jgi:hypothetical protein
MATIAIIFFILSWVFCSAIIYLDRNFKWFPIFRCWYSVFGILCVVAANYWFIWPQRLTAREALESLAITFLVSFPGIYTADHIHWLRENRRKMPRILLFEMLMRNGRSKKS